MIAPSKHAIGITSTTGVEILIHVGLDTVQLNGEGFELLVQEHEKIDRNQPLLNFNKERSNNKGMTQSFQLLSLTLVSSKKL